jgi:hypothetical protein
MRPSITRALAIAAAAVVLGCLEVKVALGETLKPYILADTPPGDFAQVVDKVKGVLESNRFKLVGTYTPFPGATVICVTHPAARAAAASAFNGGFGAVQRVSVTDVKGKIQVAYVNPAYLGTAYGLGKLEPVSQALKSALGARQDFGSVGIEDENLKPGVYRYGAFMPYFRDVDLLKEHPDHKTAVETVEKNLAAGVGGTVKVYRVDLPGDVSVFGVGLPKGPFDGPDQGNVDTDKEILEIVDWQDLRHTAYLPYELMVKGGQVIALRARYRIALHFPDTKMAGAHGFTKIMNAPWAIQIAFEKVAGFDRGY